MPNQENAPKKAQISLAQYMKEKDKLTKSKLKLRFPLMVKIAISVPGVILAAILLYTIFHLSHLKD